MSELPHRIQARPSGSKKDGAAQAKGAPILTGLIGASIQESGSPLMHMEEARASGLNYLYKLFDLDFIEGGATALARVLDEVERDGYAGVNITHPCKQRVVPLLHELSPDAEALGAVNTVVFRQGRRIGHNTDCVGFAEGLARGLPEASLECVVVLGAGGGGAAVTYALLSKGARTVVVHDVDDGKAASLAARLAGKFQNAHVVFTDDLTEVVKSCKGIVNCTPVGMSKYPGIPIDQDMIHAGHWIADIVYFPLETALLKAARARGCQTLDGGGMAVFQAAEAFKLFTGRSPDHPRMLQRFRETYER